MDAHRERFEQYYRKWKTHIQDDEIALSSSDDAYIQNPPYRAMVAMGWDAVPHIIEKLRTDEDAHFLIHALKEITGKQFMEDDIKAARAQYGRPLGNQAYAAMWIEWWNERQGSTNQS